MKIQSLFQKPIGRNIEGVIKAHDDQDLLTEVEEYVITDEVARGLESFIDAYNDYRGANGVWVSGFFGSGKSHLLKMLALLLENRSLGRTPVRELFAPKLADNPMLRGQIDKAVATPSQSILFNIDQKATLTSKRQPDAVLGVFLKVFNAACGYFEEQPYIADFERDLDGRGLLDAFKSAYAGVAGKAWERGREEAILEGPHVDRAYAQVAEDGSRAPTDILGQYRADHAVSIEGFARLVKQYIDRHERGYRVNFFVDEVGQYIVDDVKLMTNLQSIAESLATQCRGASWIVVTAQEDMTSVLGDMQPEEGDDFTKIQDRFKTRLKLTSRNVDEVIQKRLLLKTTDGSLVLGDVYERERNHLGTLFYFTGGSATYRGFRTQDDFVASYPFFPYQYTLFQQAIQDLSRHDAFEGKHSSVGERSMLGVFQDVVKTLKDDSVGAVPTFDLMYEGIRSTLKSQIQTSIQFAEAHLGDAFAVKVLKALFLVKYVKPFRATADNIRVLMQARLDEDAPALLARVTSALDLLEQQTYIQREGTVYEYLTDEEKDVEKEIKSLVVGNDEVREVLRDVITGDILRDSSHRYDETGQSFPFERWLDDTRLTPRQYDMAVRFVSPLHEHAGELEVLKSHALGRRELTVVMADEPRLLNDLVMYTKTAKYLKQTSHVDQSPTVGLILAEKGQQNSRRRTEIAAHARESVASSTLLIQGVEADVSASDPTQRIAQGLDRLIKQVYPNLRMLPATPYHVDLLPRILDLSQGRMEETRDILSEAHTEVLNAVSNRAAEGMRVTLHYLINERFMRPPYGWYLAAIQCIVAGLYAAGKIDVVADSQLLQEADDIERALTNSHGWQSVNLRPQIEWDPRQIRALRDFAYAFFARPASHADARSLGREAAQQFQRLSEDLLHAVRGAARGYPFAEKLAEAQRTIADLAGRSYDVYLTEIPARQDDLLDLKEEVIDPALEFLRGPKREIYDDARRFLERQEANLPWATESHVGQLRALLADPNCHLGNAMQQVKVLKDGVEAEIQAALEGEIEAARQAGDALLAQAEGWPDLRALPDEPRDEVLRPLRRYLATIGDMTVIPTARYAASRLQNEIKNEMLTAIARLTYPQPEPAPPDTVTIGDGGDGEPGGTAQCAENAVEYVVQTRIQVPFFKPALESEQDVEAYVAALKKAYLAAIRDRKRITISQ